MCPESRDHRGQLPEKGTDRSRQQGAGLPMAIFLITVMALIVTTITQLQQSTSEMETLDIQSVRAFYAAESGAQMALSVLLPPDGSAGASCSGEIYTQSPFPEEGLRGCSATVTCNQETVIVEGEPENYYTLTSTGTCGSGREQGQRVIEVRAQ